MRHTYIDEHSDIDSFIHRLEPRIKIVSFIAIILSVVLTRPGILSGFPLYGILIGILILISNVPPGFIFKRSLTIAPFVLLICVFIPFIKEDGLLIFANILIKAYLSTLCMIIIMATTKFSDFLKALERLRIPRLFVMVLSFMYRYIFVIEDESMKMRQAKEARSLGKSGWSDFKVTANMAGVLFIRSYERAESVYLAMCARGYNGRVKTIDDLRIKRRDMVFLIVIIISLASINLAAL